MVLALLLIVGILYAGIVSFQKKTFRILTMVLYPFLRIFIMIRVRMGLEDKDRVTERFGIPSQPRPFGKLIWIHAVSVGEVISSLAFIEEFKKINKDATVVITTITIESANIVRERLGDSVIHQYLPYDVFMWVRRFVKYWRPDAVFFVESELWPNTLYYLYEKDIPTYLLNTRISSKTLRRMQLAKKIFGILPYKLFTAVFVPSDEVKIYVRDLGAREVVVIPNLKIISKKLPVNKESAEKLEDMIKDRKTWMIVSTHKGEEEIVINAHKILKEKIPNVLTIIATRHPERAGEVIKLCETAGFSVDCYSKKCEVKENITEDFCIVDKMGCLGDFFDKVDTIVMGGSLVPGIGGHNFLEPLQFMCNVATGKYIENFRDVYEYVSKSCRKLENEGDLVDFVLESLETYQRPIKMHQDLIHTNYWEKAIKQMSGFIYKNW